MFDELLDDISDYKLRFIDGNDNLIIIWKNRKPKPKYLVVLGTHLEFGDTVYSAYAKTGGTVKIVSAKGLALINSPAFHFYEEEIEEMFLSLENQIVGDILSANVENGAIELEDFKNEFYLG